MLVIIQKPKMRRLTARRAYVRIDIPLFIEFVDAFLLLFPAGSRIFSGSYYHLREIFGAVCSNLGLPTSGDTPLSLGSFRPGGATWLYRAMDSPESVRFSRPVG